MSDEYKFDPASLTMTSGETVTWENTGKMPHTATCDPSKAANPDDVALPSGAEPWDSGILNPGESFSVTLTVAGDYKYFCTPHETLGMIGTITVE